MMNKKSLIACGLAALSLGVAPAIAEPVKVGMITTLSGGGASLGVDVRDGFQLALDQAEGAEIELVVEDDARDPAKAVQLADQMIQQDEVDILTGIIWSNLALAVVPSALAQGKFYISPNAGPSQLAGERCDENYFNVAWQNDNLHEAMGAYANENYEKAFIMAPNYPAGQDGLTGFKRFFEGEIVSETYTQLGQTDYAAEIAQIRASEADVVYIFLPGGMGISFMKQYSGSGVDIPIVSTAFTFGQDVLPAMGEAALGVVNTSQWSPDLDNEANKAFVESFKETYDRIPSLYASQGFDAANLIISALEKADVSDADAFRAALMEADFESTRGDFEFGSNNHPIQDIYVREVVDQDGVLINKTLGVALEDHQDAYASECKL